MGMIVMATMLSLINLEVRAIIAIPVLRDWKKQNTKMAYTITSTSITTNSHVIPNEIPTIAPAKSPHSERTIIRYNITAGKKVNSKIYAYESTSEIVIPTKREPMPFSIYSGLIFAWDSKDVFLYLAI